VIPVRRPLLGAVAALVAAVGLLVLPASPASAHSQVIASNPTDGQRVETSPSELRVTLSEPGRLPSVIVSLVGPDGAVTTLGAATEQSRDDAGHQVVVVPVTADLPTGLYRMSFTVTSAFDGHTTLSQLVFGVRTDVAAPIGTEGAVSTNTAEDSVRAVVQGALLFAAGIAFGFLLLLPGASGRGRRGASVAAVVGMGAAVCSGLLWHEGFGLAVAVAGLLGTAALFLLARRGPQEGRARTWAVVGALVVAVGPLALVGHVASEGGLFTLVAVLHVVTTAAWMGTLVGAAVLTRGLDRDDRLPLLRRTSALGGSTFLVAMASGLLMSASVVPSIGGLVGSAYGWGLLVKIALLLPVLLLALVARERLRGGRPTSVLVEASLLVAVALVGVFVAAQPPPVAARFQPTPAWAADGAPVADSADDLLISSQIDPNTPGQRFLVVRVDNTRRPAPAPVTGVVASMADGPDVAMTRGEDGLWTATVSIPEPGPVLVHVAVSRPQLPTAVVATQWNVGPVPGTQAGGPTLTRFVALAIAGLVVSWLLVLLVEAMVGGRRREVVAPGEELVSEDAESVSV
jgi:copper transport protein